METKFKQKTFTEAFSTFSNNYQLWNPSDKEPRTVRVVIEGIKLITEDNKLMKDINVLLKNIGGQQEFTAQDVTEKIASGSYDDLCKGLQSFVPHLFGPTGDDALNKFKVIQDPIKSKSVKKEIKDFYTACYNIAIFCRLISDANKK